MTKKHVHFMGIGGSGLSGVALLAKRHGFEVSGCDLEKSTDCIKLIKKNGIKVQAGHDPGHLHDSFLLVTTPAVFFTDRKHRELFKGEQLGVAMTWQKFLGDYLQKDKKVISISGTHGKSTTTAMAGLLFEKSGLDPLVMIGAKVKEWGANFRFGEGKYFFTESDEFYDNFLNYRPEIIILNNIEFDHPDYFKDEKQLLESFRRHVKSLRGKKVLIINQDSKWIGKLMKRLDHKFLKGINLYGYTLLRKPVVKLDNSTRGEIIQLSEDKSVYKAVNKKLKLNNIFTLSVPGRYNIQNSLGVIILASLLKIPTGDIGKSLKNFIGIGRRLEKIGEKNAVVVYDDYAHHPTAIKSTLSALRQKYPNNRIIAVIEPHSFSRTKALLKKYKNTFNNADKVFVVPIFRARDKSDFGVSSNSIVKESDHKNISSAKSAEVISFIKNNRKKGDVIIVMGAGKSYQLARDVLKNL